MIGLGEGRGQLRVRSVGVWRKKAKSMFECDKEEFMMCIERRGCLPQNGLIKKWAESMMGFEERDYTNGS